MLLRILLYLSLIILLVCFFQCSKSTPVATEDITNINGNWSGTTNQNEPITFTIDQGRITKWFIRVSGGGTTQTIQSVGNIGIANNTFVLNSTDLIINGSIESNTASSGDFSFRGENGTWSATKTSAGTQTGFPDEAEIIFPPDGEKLIFNELVISWRSSDPNDDNLTHDVFLGPNSSPPIVASGIEENFFATGPLEANTTYAFRVDVTDEDGNTNMGITHYFETGAFQNQMTLINQNGTGYDLINTIDNNLALIGEKTFGFGDDRLYLQKIAQSGELIWESVFEDIKVNGIFEFSLTQTNDNGFVLAANQQNDTSRHIYVLKTNDVGTKLWDLSIDDGKESFSENILPNADNTTTLLSNWQRRDSTSGINTTIFPKNIRLTKLGQNGNIIWDNIFEFRRGHNYSVYHVHTLDGGYLVTGNISGPQPGSILFKVTENGEQVWNRNYGMWLEGPIIATSDGNYLISGRMESQLWILKVNSEGDEIYSKTFGSGITDIGGIVATDNDNYVALCSASNDHYLYIIDANGNEVGVVNYSYLTYDMEALIAAQDGSIKLLGSQFSPYYLFLISFDPDFLQ